MPTVRRYASARGAGRLPHVVVFAVAFGLRLLVPLTGRGLVANYSYDASVYYSAGAALVHGRLPYRDFILLHPPGGPLALAPAAWIGRLTSDHTGFALATLQFIALGATSAVLVAVVARRMGVGRWAATAGALFYAMWFLSIRSEHVARLEPLGNVLVLSALAGYTGIGGRHGRRAAVLCGVGFGAAASVKVWYAVPLAVVLCFVAARHRRADAGRVALGAVATAAVICGPFFVLAPSSMWRMVVAQQLGRDPANPFRTFLLRQHLPPGVSGTAANALGVALLAAVVVLVVATWRAPVVRLPAALLAAGVAVLLAGPSWFLFYADYLTPAAALCVAAGAAAAPRLARAWAVAGTGVVVLALVVPATRLWYGPEPRVPQPSPELAAAVADVGCVMSDSPMALIGLDVLHRTLARGCPNWVDVTGRTYASDMAVRDRDGRRVPRVANARWQEALREYLLSGDASIVVRARDAGISPATADAIAAGGVLATDGAHVIYRS